MGKYNLEEILEKKERYLSCLSILPKESLDKIMMAFKIEFTHNSTAIEGNTLSLIETKVVLEDGVSVGGKQLREIYEVINNHKAMLYVEECITNAIELDENIIKDIHAIINENIIVGGIYRNQPVMITGASFKPPVGQNMYHEIKNFYLDLMTKEKSNPIELAAWTHAEFVRIHPFIDGNGRTSRLIMNFQLMKNGLPPVSISAKDALSYYEALDKYGSDRDLLPFTELLAELVESRLDDFLELI